MAFVGDGPCHCLSPGDGQAERVAAAAYSNIASAHVVELLLSWCRRFMVFGAGQRATGARRRSRSFVRPRRVARRDYSPQNAI